MIYNKDINLTVLYENDLNINQLNSEISFLYSDKQEIYIDYYYSKYYLVFKKKVYNKEPLILYNNDNGNVKSIYLNCSEDTEELRCSISKGELTGILSRDDEIFYLSQLTKSEGILKFENVLNITINFYDVIKNNIYLGITKLLTPNVGLNNYIVFETNITDTEIITTDYFTLNQNRNDAMKCLFKKSNNQRDDKLLLLCDADSHGEYQLDINGTELEDINILYTFIIPPTKITEKINVVDKEGTKILSVYPDTLDFNINDTLTIKYQTQNPERLNNIKLNIDSATELECKNLKDYKECNIPQSHFNNSGYYYTYYINCLGDNVISYEIPKIQIILKKNDEGNTDDGSNGQSKKNLVGIIVGSVVGGVVLIAAIVIIIIYVKKRKSKLNEIDTGKIGNILPNSNNKVELLDGDNFGSD